MSLLVNFDPPDADLIMLEANPRRPPPVPILPAVFTILERMFSISP
jgi:hypothetical protein